MNIPELEHHCGSWVVINKATGEAVLETFSKKVAEAINQDLYQVKTSLQYLTSINQ